MGQLGALALCKARVDMVSAVWAWPRLCKKASIMQGPRNRTRLPHDQRALGAQFADEILELFHLQEERTLRGNDFMSGAMSVIFNARF
jgi:hypothetical protein